MISENNPKPLWELSRLELLVIDKDDLIDSIRYLTILLLNAKDKIKMLESQIEFGAEYVRRTSQKREN